MHTKILEALQSCTAGGYRDIDGDWVTRQCFDVQKVKEAIEMLEAAPSTNQPFGWTKQSEIDSSKTYGGTFNVWLQKYDCDVPIYTTPQAAPSTSPTDGKIAELCNEVTRIAATYHDHQSLHARMSSAIVKAIKGATP